MSLCAQRGVALAGLSYRSTSSIACGTPAVAPIRQPMECPKCGFASGADGAECGRCGVVIAKFLRAHDQHLPLLAPGASQLEDDRARVRAEGAERRRELFARALALPCALLGSWLAVKTAPAAVRMLTMWVHESGHALSAWLCGYLAWPGPWFTPVGTERSFTLTLLLAGLMASGAVHAWQRTRRFWAVVAVASMLVMLFCTVSLQPGQAQQLIVFGGDGGCLVLGSALMLTVYARPDHPVRREHLRWALLALGALAFMDGYAVWSGGLEQLPFGENENGLSDPSVLVEAFGWSVLGLVDRYTQVAHACLAVLAAAYVTGLAGAAIALRPERESR
jgi:hypothetical protein